MSGCCRVGTREHSSRQGRTTARLLLAGKGAVPARQHHKASLRSLPVHTSFRPCAGLARRQASACLQAETSEVASVCGCGWPQFSILPWVAAGAWVGPTAPLPGSRTWSPRPSRRRQDRQRAAGVEAAEPVRSSGDSRYIFTVNPAGPTSSICYPIRTAAPLVLRRQQDRCRRTCPNGRITTALVDPDGSGLVTEAIPDPTLHAWWVALISTR
jgi:hypothetical protein